MAESSLRPQKPSESAAGAIWRRLWSALGAGYWIIAMTAGMFRELSGPETP